MGQTDRAGRPDLRGRGWRSRDSAAPFSYPHRTRAAKTKFKITTVETAESRSLQKSSRQKQARTNQDETIPQEGAKVRRETCLLHNEMKALKKG
jgi:hypothetical protein